MTSYAEVDGVIDAWAAAHVKKLFTDWAGAAARFAYFPGLRSLECFQVSIDPPQAGRVTVSAWSIDTDDGSEFERRWEGRTADLSVMLEQATDAVRGWMNRSPANGCPPLTPDRPARSTS